MSLHVAHLFFTVCKKWSSILGALAPGRPTGWSKSKSTRRGCITSSILLTDATEEKRKWLAKNVVKKMEAGQDARELVCTKMSASPATWWTCSSTDDGVSQGAVAIAVQRAMREAEQLQQQREAEEAGASWHRLKPPRLTSTGAVLLCAAAALLPFVSTAECLRKRHFESRRHEIAKIAGCGSGAACRGGAGLSQGTGGRPAA